MIGRDKSPGGDAPVEIHLAHDALTDLNGLKGTLERPGKGSLKHLLQPAFYIAQGHDVSTVPVIALSFPALTIA